MDILCLGDSNTFGYLPHSLFQRDQAWPSLYPTHLKDPVQVQIDGACGRFFLDPLGGESRSDGRARLTLHAGKGPWAGLILQLGTNDLMTREVGTDTLAAAMAASLQAFHQAQARAQILILLPAFRPALEDPFWIGTTYAGLQAKADRFARLLQSQDLPPHTSLMDTAPFLKDSPDGVHLTHQGHRNLAAHIAQAWPLTLT